MDGFTQFDGNLLIGIQQTLNADWLTPVMKVIWNIEYIDRIMAGQVGYRAEKLQEPQGSQRD